MSGSAPKPYQRLVLTPRSAPGGATAAAPAPAAATAAATATAAAPAPARSSIFGAAKPREQVLLEKGIDVQAQERKLEQRTQRLPRMNKSQEEEFKELESLLASATSTAASEDASVVRACVRACVNACVRACLRVLLHVLRWRRVAVAPTLCVRACARQHASITSHRQTHTHTTTTCDRRRGRRRRTMCRS
jgi:hypothetical protein